MRTRSHIIALLFCLAALIGLSYGQDPSASELVITTKTLPAGSLWNQYGEKNRYGFLLQAEGGVGQRHWRVINGALPRGLKLEDYGEISGVPEETGQFSFTLSVRDSNNPPAEAQKTIPLTIESPFSAEWERKAYVNGQRIDGTVKVSNRTGRDFDLTFIVLAVNDIGRATAIGYQRFSLKRGTADFSLPFGDTLSPGSYTVNVDVVAEEPVSNRIFRARLVSGKQAISQGP